MSSSSTGKADSNGQDRLTDTNATTAAEGPAPAAVVAREAKRVPVFDGVRGLAALGLLVVHVAFAGSLIGSYDVPPSNRWGAYIVNGFQLSLGVFFLISGLFLYRPFARAIIAGTRKPELGPYLLRRALRLLPPYYVMTAAALLLLNFNSIDSVWYVLRPIVLMQNYDPVWMAGMDISWTVPTEVQWYLVLPVIAWLSGKWARRAPDPIARARRLMLPIPILFVVGFAWTVYLHLPSTGLYPPQYWWPFGMAGNIGFGMILGILSARVQVVPDRIPALFRAAAARPNLFWLGAFALFVINCAKPFGRPGYGDYDTMAAALLFYVLLIVAAFLIITPMIAPHAKSRLIDAILGNRPVVYLGRVSYGLYLWHFVVLNLVLRNGSIFGGDPLQLGFLRGRMGFWELEITVFLLTLTVATVSYFVVERPILNFGERYLNARKTRTAALAAVNPAAPKPATESAAV
ncbi:acyltransferase family protein [Micromonospora sp. NPDC051543]|uniref:acyltransferase family protein n=1 Tax=Micromonospora sp. NPDC051543 TaxID=3364287 RepID=UPI00379516BA